MYSLWSNYIYIHRELWHYTAPGKLWSTNIFGNSLNELVSEGVQAKLLHMPQEARARLQQTLERIINEGCDGLICILL